MLKRFILLGLLLVPSLILAGGPGVPTHVPIERFVPTVLPPAGTVVAPPVRLTEGPLVASITPGALEFYDHALYFTTYLVRRTVSLTQDVVIEPVIAQATTTEIVLYSASMAPNFLTVGKMSNMNLHGQISMTAAGATTMRAFLSHNGIHIATATVAGGALASAVFDIDTTFTCRGTGQNGSYAVFVDIQLPGSSDAHSFTVGSIDTTSVNTLEFSVQYSSANAANVFVLQSGWTDSLH